MQYQPPVSLTSGETVFFRPQASLWALRSAAKNALSEGAPTTRFVVTAHEYYYECGVDALFQDLNRLFATAEELDNAIAGCVSGRWRCAAIWNVVRWEGLLLHKCDAQLHMAYIPLLDETRVRQEQDAARALNALMQSASDMPIRIKRPIAAGRATLGETLAACDWSGERL